MHLGNSFWNITWVSSCYSATFTVTVLMTHNAGHEWAFADWTDQQFQSPLNRLLVPHSTWPAIQGVNTWVCMTDYSTCQTQWCIHCTQVPPLYTSLLHTQLWSDNRLPPSIHWSHKAIHMTLVHCVHNSTAGIHRCHIAVHAVLAKSNQSKRKSMLPTVEYQGHTYVHVYTFTWTRPGSTCHYTHLHGPSHLVWRCRPLQGTSCN